MVRYTAEKLDKIIPDLDKAIEAHNNITKLYKELKRSFERIRFAMIEDFELVLRTKLEQAKKEQLEKLRKEDESHYRFKNHNMIASVRAKRALCDEFKIILGTSEFERWDEFKFKLKKIWQHDREKLIKDGDIEGELKNESCKNQ